MKRIIKKAIAVILCMTCIMQFSGQAFAAGLFGKTYVKEVFLSYGYTPEEAKKYLTDNGYEIVDHNLNEGADSALSKKRAVYLGYKTTKDPEEAITDMKLMNMNGNYSVSDYQLLLEEQKANIRFFVDDFIVAISEYRENYAKGLSRAIAAHDMLNLLYDDDTETPLGELFLERIREEYSEEEFAALSDSEKAKHADMTTILMQSNGVSILAVEQIIALSTDSSGSGWIERYDGVMSYDAMLEDLIDGEGLSPSRAETSLSAMYDDDARILASKLPEYLEYLKTYSESGITLASPEEEINAYFKDKDNTALLQWLNAGTQYVILGCAADADGTSLLELISDKSNDFENDDICLLYPIVSVLTEGQKACMNFLPMYQLVSLGINDDSAINDVMSKLDTGDETDSVVSIYSGIDRAIFTEKVAMTSAAESLQQSSDKDMSKNWFDDGISPVTKVLYIALGVSALATVGSFTASYLFGRAYLANVQSAQNAANNTVNRFLALSHEYMNAPHNDYLAATRNFADNDFLAARSDAQRYLAASETDKLWGSVFRYVGIGMACVTLVLMAVSLWSTIDDLIDYYNSELSPIPLYLVNQGINEKDEKTFTYYKAVSCNRREAKLTDDRTSVLESCGDINGDVGLQWVALYTTCDRAAGDPITADFVVQYANPNIPGEKTALSLFGEKVAQNLTNEKSGFTYSDSKSGIYLFYDTDPSAFAGSVITGGFYALIAGAFIIVIAAAFYIASRKRKGKSKEKAG